MCFSSLSSSLSSIDALCLWNVIKSCSGRTCRSPIHVTSSFCDPVYLGSSSTLNMLQPNELCTCSHLSDHICIIQNSLTFFSLSQGFHMLLISILTLLISPAEHRMGIESFSLRNLLVSLSH